MNKVILTSIFCLVFNFCFAQTESGKVVISGKFKSNPAEPVSIENNKGEKIFSASLPSNGEIIIPVIVTAGYYNIIFSEEMGHLYLRPGYDVNISIDFAQFDESIKFTGKGAPENNFLAEKLLNIEAFKKAGSGKEYYNLDEEKFLEFNESLYRMKKDFLTKATGINKEFRYLEAQTIELEKRYERVNYPMMRKVATNNWEYKVSATYPDPFLGLDMENEKLLSIAIYPELILAYVFDKANPIMINNSQQDPYIVWLNILDTSIQNTTIKEQIAFDIIDIGIHRSKQKDELYKKYISQYKNVNNRKIIDEKYNTIKSTSKGQPSPDFNFKDINDKNYSLADFSGKYVYIDIWATWCGPCLREIPHLKTLESELHDKNIAFVSICTSDKFENWVKMIKEQELSGIQLFAADNSDSFFKKYSLTGIPRFILLDKEGKILDPDALRPSDPKLKEQLLQLN